MSGQQATILVTGARGLLGRRLCERLKKEGERVVALDYEKESGPWDRFIEIGEEGRLSEPEAMEGVRIVYHLARSFRTHPVPSGNGTETAGLIVESTRSLLNACSLHGVGRFVLVSSVKAMGEGNPEGIPLVPLSENWPHTPQSPYGRAKAEAEELVRSSTLSHWVILRPAMIYGPGFTGCFGRIRKAATRFPYRLLPECGNKCSLIHVDDVIEFAIRSANRPRASGRTYILSCPEALSTRQLYGAVWKSLGMNERGATLPLWILRAAARLWPSTNGSPVREMRFNREVLDELTRSAWYASDRAEEELGYRCQRASFAGMAKGD